MKKLTFIFGAIMAIILASACGNSTNHSTNKDTVSTDTTMQRDTMMPDTSMIQYRDSNSTQSNGVIPPTS